MPAWSHILLYRAVTLVADVLLAFITATVIIPTLAAWLHQQSGAAHGSLTMAGTIALWLMPLFFLVTLLAAGEIATMRAVWRWATGRIQKARTAGAERATTDRPGTSVTHRETTRRGRRRR
ncbi:hypothetical protein ACIQUM_07780 [Amycolatopsis azurea]|uniref:hypothetical protein n=1 Tax=Amycolatopsis azurea TaxID=36819 RepID=UPI003808CE51